MSREKKVLVLGGGSSGWTTAAYLNAALNNGGQKNVDITLVESPDVGTIGVGEATIPNINHVLSVIGIDEIDFLKAVDGTFKQSIRFVNWLHEKPHFYHHPFSRYGQSRADDAGRRWLMSDRSVPFINTIAAQPIFCEMGLSPKPFERVNLGVALGYAFHMDATKFAALLTKHSTDRGVGHVLEHVVGTEMRNNGEIDSVITASGRRLEADLYVDCTGFAAALMEKKLGVPWVDCSEWLICDRAITINVPYEKYYPGKVNPYTTATALSSGWVWDIPLQTRRALGYVHSSAHISVDQAEAEMRDMEGPHANDLSSRIVNFKVGRRKQQWVANCVSIGLSGGFIEPLESTGLYLSQIAAELLVEHFPYTDDMAPFAFRFNRIMANRFYEILDFVNMHYCLTKRRDSEFWREIGRPERINGRLKAKLDYWRIKPPSTSDFNDQFFPGQPTQIIESGEPDGDNRFVIDTGYLWNHHSYEAVLYGMDFLRDECERWFGSNRPPPAVNRQVLDAMEKAQKHLPPHDIWLRKVVNMGDYSSI
tara:strand:+ start:6661 stop:8268 length:1608 start_codon:yes stop_codon:yes gene_type:complete